MVRCRICNNEDFIELIDLGISPLANSLLKNKKEIKKEYLLPLKALVCRKCYLVQLSKKANPKKIFNKNYLYYSGYSNTWKKHCKKYSKKIIKRFSLTNLSHVLEVGSNDGSMLENFSSENIKVSGVDPSVSCNEISRKKNIYTIDSFFSKTVAKKIVKTRGKADLIIANNVLAHVPDLHDFIWGFETMLNCNGIITFEFPHLYSLIKKNQFDTIYHEHYSYLSIKPLQKLFKMYDLKIFDIEKISTHGGSLRVFVCKNNSSHSIRTSVCNVIKEEKVFGLYNLRTYKEFSKKIEKIKADTLKFFNNASKKNKKIVAYGAPAKGNTFLNFCNIKAKNIIFTVDKNKMKQKKLLPGTHIPVYGPEKLLQIKPDYIFILPWNLKNEIYEEVNSIIDYKVKFIIAIPKLNIF
ncbi:MAG: hypothetical protein CBC82_06810 [Cellvibrionales bacterium TMED122]|nr:MAG: hypothetical protein CBC82_06810 [Cellvibrionales bacterium TMED122]